jgi:hypothetical protein
VSILKALFNPTFRPERLSVMEDPTVYKVMTQTDSYCGRISYQDNTIIWLKVGGKPVKILKENIVRINIL